MAGGVSDGKRFKVARSAEISSKADVIFDYLNDFHRWAEWSPWDQIDPSMQRIYSGAPFGEGAIYAWSGNGKAGAGRMEIIDSTPGVQVVIKLDFSKPFEAHNQVELTLTPGPESTLVTWEMTGPQTFLSKLMGVIFNMDGMVGKDFERGLANLKILAEA